MFRSVVLSVALLFTQNVFAAGSMQIRVLSFNIKGLPGIAGGYNKSRFKEIGKMLLQRRMNGTAPDFVLLQESFISETKALRTEAQYPYIVKGPEDEKEYDENGKKVSKIYNAGLYIMSLHPLSNAQKMIYGKGVCNSWDCNANKGLHVVSADVPGLPFKLNIANTHLQASAKYDETRIKQMDIANRHLAKHAATGALFFGGDFNIRPELASYPYWFKTSGLKSTGEYCINPNQTNCTIKPGTDRDWIVKLTKDHIFYREGLTATPNGNVDVTITPITVERNFTELHEGKPLSDHMGFEAVYNISWR